MATIHHVPVRPRGEPAPWSLAWLKKRCRKYRQDLMRPGAPNAAFIQEEIQDYWPKSAPGDWRGVKPEDVGTRNDFSGKGAWLWCHAQLIRLLGASEAKRADPVREDAFRALGKATRREPKRVVLSDGQERFVHQKSLPALLFLDALKVDLAIVGERQALEIKHASQYEELTLIPLVRSLAYQYFAWVVTHDDVGLPFSLSEKLPAPPDWTQNLTPEDFFLLASAHVDVNHHRLQLTASISPPDGTPSILPVEGWVAAYAHEKGRSSFEMLDRTSLGEIFAEAVSATVAAEESKKQSETPAPDEPAMALA